MVEALSNKVVTNPVRPGQEAQAPVLQGGVLESVPEADGAGRLRVQEGAVLVRRHGAADLGLLADDHALEAARVREAEAVGDGSGVRDGGGRQGREEAGEGRAERVQVVADLVDGALLGLGEVAGGVEGVWSWGLVRATHHVNLCLPSREGS